MWLFLWVFISAVVLGVSFWSMAILMQQKKAWAAYAKKKALHFEKNKFMASPTVSGSLNGYAILLSTGVKQTSDIRGQRFVTVIEVAVGDSMPATAVIATKEFDTLASTLQLAQNYEPDLKDWKDEYIIRTDDSETVSSYLTLERLKILKALFGMSGAAVIFFFDRKDAVLRIETSDPLKNQAHLDKIVDQTVKAAEILAYKKTDLEKTDQATKKEKNKP